MRKYPLLAALSCLAIPSASAAEPARWDGLYVGGHAGGSWGTHNALIEIGPVNIPAYMDRGGALAGGHGGYNMQFGPWVVGVEGAYDRAWISGKSATVADMITPGAVINTTSDTSWLASLSARFGYAFGRTLLFGKAGFARTDFDYQGATSVGGVVLGGGARSGTRSGWTIGTGFEQALDSSWSWRLEYDYFDFGEKSYVFAGVTPVTLEPRYHAVRAGLTYGLNAR